MEYVTLEEVEQAYLDCRRNKRRKASAVKYEMNYEVNNYELWRELNSMTYKVGKSIAFCVTRPKLREVFAADFRDRIVHHLIMLKLLPLLESEMIEDSYNCRKGKGTIYGARRLKEHIEYVSEDYTKEAWVLKCDIQGFFMSIDKDILWTLLRDVMITKYKGDNLDWWMWLLKTVVYHRPEQNCEIHGDENMWNDLPDDKTLFRTNGRGLPIGNLTSQIFANLYMTYFDWWVIDNIGRDDRYVRYVDDFVVISKDKSRLLKLLERARPWLKENLNVRLHPKKVYLQEVRKGIEFIGTVIKPHRTYSTKRIVYNAFSAVERYNEGRLPLENFVQAVNSYLGFLIHNNTYGIRWMVWKQIDDKSRMRNDNMRKIVIINNNIRFEQVERNGILIAEWTKLNNDELHQDNSCDIRI